jgi:hypothetical protein
MQLIINGYEFGQLLRILLWIGMPLTVFLTLLTTWLHYRRSHGAGRLVLSMEGMDNGDVFSMEPDDLDGDGRVDTERSIKDGEEDYKENLYKGILWMKEKYEQYRDLADERHERLKDQLTRMEKKYEDLLARVQSANPGLLDEATSVLTTFPVSGQVQDRTDTIGLAGEEGMAGMAELREMPLDVRAEEFPIERPVEFGGPREFNEPREFSGGAEIVVERAEASGERVRTQELEEQLARTQQRFDEEVGRLRHQLDEEIARGRRLQDEKNAGVDANRLLEQHAFHSSRQLEEKQRLIADLEGQLTTDRLKIDELVTKLRNNSQLLTNIYQELDKSLDFSDPPPQG